MRLVRSELLKMFTTHAWWLFGLGALATLALAFFFNALGAHFLFTQELPEGMSEQDQAVMEASRDVVAQAASLYTSGQFFGLMFVLLLGVVLITNEFHHQTLTTTFLTTPHRTAVVLAKLAVAGLGGVVLWAITTAINIPATAVFLSAYDYGPQLGEAPVVRAILLNLLAYVLWGIFGLGFGVLLRSQIGATVTAIVLYLGGFIGAVVLFLLLSNWLGDWVLEYQVIVPSVASQLMVAGVDLPGNPPQWVGAAVLIGYALVAGLIGTLILRRRDVS